MGRYLGPKHKICRRVGEKVCGKDKCPVMRRNFPAGVHGPKGRKKLTPYGTEVLEKQKAKRTYGLLERQFHRYYLLAQKQRGDANLHFGQLLERRLDNVVYRIGLAKTREQARQAVRHGHVSVNEKRVTIPSYSVRAGDMIQIGERAKARDKFLEELAPQTKETSFPSWLAVDAAAGTGKITGDPSSDDLPKNINFKIIIEYYSR